MDTLMRRRDFVQALGGFAAFQATTQSALCETALKTPLIVWAAAFPMRKELGFLPAFRAGLFEQNLVEGRDYELAHRFGRGLADFPKLIEDIIALSPNVIIAPATLEALAFKKVTSTIPIVCPALANAVQLGLIKSVARPGMNVTGIEPYIAGLPTKQVELAREVIPFCKTVGLLTNNADPKGPPQIPDLRRAAEAFGLNAIEANANGIDEIGEALASLSRAGANVIIVLQTNLLLLNAPLIAGVALEKALPTVFGYREHVVAGGLVSYGVGSLPGGQDYSRKQTVRSAYRVSD
jgi:putative ABC transport system substrate-binding protein